MYNRVHIGNIRAFLFADTLQRYLRFGKEYSIRWVMNITDVDDKTIRDSQKEFSNLEPLDALKKFTQIYSEKFFEDLEKLNIEKEHFFATPHATDCIAEMKTLVQKIVENGFGYEKNGSVYFDINAYRKKYEYGQLVTVDFENMKSTSRVEGDEYEKESLADFVIWKAKKEGEPSWSFSLNTAEGKNISCEGRPGWHLECSAMEKEILELPFDIHSGGVDLCFPHHEDEIAQSIAGYGVDPNTYWVHNEHLMVDGKKMSKSLGNFYTLEDLVEKGFSEAVVRFFLVSNHYRTKLNLSDEALSSAAQLLKRIQNFLQLIEKEQNSSSAKNNDNNSIQSLPLAKNDIDGFREKFFAALDDDLNVSVALSEFFSFLKEASSRGFSGQTGGYDFFVETVKVVESIFGISFFPQQNTVPEEVLDLFFLRKKAREKKEWNESDRLRDKISALGYEVRDGKNEGVFIA